MPQPSFPGGQAGRSGLSPKRDDLGIFAGGLVGGANGGGVTNDGLGRFRAKSDLLALLDLAFFGGGLAIRGWPRELGGLP